MILDELEAILQERKGAAADASYTAELLHDHDRMQRKIMEEAFELCLELGRPDVDRERVASEAADLVFHTLVGLVAAGVAVGEVFAVLEGRRR